MLTCCEIVPPLLMSGNPVFQVLNIFPLQPMKLIQGVDKNALLDAIGKNCEFMSTDMLLSLINDFIGAFSDWGRRQTLATAERVYKVCTAMASSTIAVQQNLSGIKFIFVYKMVRMSLSLVQLPAIAAWNAAALCSRQGNVDYQTVLTQVSFYLRHAYNHLKEMPIQEFPAIDTRFALNFIGAIYLETQVVKEISVQTGLPFANKTINIAQKLDAYNKLVKDRSTDYVRVSQISEMETLGICRRSSVQCDDTRSQDGVSPVGKSQLMLTTADLMQPEPQVQLKPYTLNFAAINTPLQIDKLLELVNYLDDYYNNLVMLGQDTHLFNDLRIVSADRAIFFRCFERFLLAFNSILQNRASYALSVFDKISTEYDRNKINTHEFYVYFAQIVAQMQESELPFNDINERLVELETQFCETTEHAVMIYPKGLTNVVQNVFVTAIDQYQNVRKTVQAVAKNVCSQMQEIKRQIDSGIGLPEPMKALKGLQLQEFKAQVQQATATEHILQFMVKTGQGDAVEVERIKKAQGLLKDLKKIRYEELTHFFEIQLQLQDTKTMQDRKRRINEQREKLLALKPNANALAEELQTQFDRELKTPVEFLQFCVTNQIHFKIGASVEENSRVFTDALKSIEKKRVSLLLHYDQDLCAIKTAVVELSKNFLRTQLDVEPDELQAPAQTVSDALSAVDEIISTAMMFSDQPGGSSPNPSVVKPIVAQQSGIDDLQVSSEQ